jgi:cytoplasmic iron level regulating protein YaaA (DUF328/UPF0246 family)
MLILLPPSETKRPGGRGPSLDLGVLALPELRPQREVMTDALVALSADEDEAARVLKLSERQRSDVAVNALLRSSPTLPAIDRYTGVLYDALDAGTLDAAARRWLGSHALIHSAPFGPVGALDRIPAYRLAAGTSVPGAPPMRRLWAEAVTTALAAASPRFVLDLRSESYAALGPVPPGVEAAYIRVVTEAGGGAARALNHFNKHAKGELVRSLATERPRMSSTKAFLQWAEQTGRTARPGRAGEVELLV